jgi:hypothetical protein
MKYLEDRPKLYTINFSEDNIKVRSAYVEPVEGDPGLYRLVNDDPYWGAKGYKFESGQSFDIDLQALASRRIKQVAQEYNTLISQVQSAMKAITALKEIKEGNYVITN